MASEGCDLFSNNCAQQSQKTMEVLNKMPSFDFRSIHRPPRLKDKQGGWAVIDFGHGDTGKAKIADALVESSENVVCVARYQGGDNSGHTVVVDGEKFAVHCIPCGVFHQDRGIKSVMGRGMVLNLTRFFGEIAALERKGVHVTPESLIVSEGIHLTLAYHMALERARESGSNKMDTTARAISQTYAFKHLYKGIRAIDLLNMDKVREKIAEPLAYVNAILEMIYHETHVSIEETMSELEIYRDRFLPFLGNEAVYLNQQLAQGKNVVFESAQSLGIDVDLGIYPYTTSSSPALGSIQHGCGVDPRWVTRVVGVIKAFTSRVGKGVFPNEMDETTAEIIRQRGGEFGTTTGRPRRILWPDNVMSSWFSLVCPPTELAITKSDILSGLNPLKVCVAYGYQGGTINQFPTDPDTLAKYEPIFRTMKGWDMDFTGAKTTSDFPQEAIDYLNEIAKPFGCPITMIGTGPGRDELIINPEL